ncbi:VPS9 domain-containing protein 1-like [Watersipora subatra]|uniref:VPS9 domain-containing protein 1-like n=1 Tax=Watersipora subatra TaxID=2589382 RepID=UPI00355C5D3D
MQNALSDCIRVGGEAINLESANRNYEAYRKYLFCCLKAFGALSSEVNDMRQENHALRLKLAKMATQCSERILSYCEKPGNTKVPLKTVEGPQSPPAQNFSQERRASTTQIPSTTAKREAQPAGDVKTFSSDTDPETLARLQNRLMLDRHRRLMETANYSSIRKANLTLDLQKKMIENMEFARKKKTLLDCQLLERQQRLKEVADRRIGAMGIADPAKQKRHNDLLTAILLHDDSHKEITSLKRGLLKDGSLDEERAGQLCTTVFSTDTHPLTMLLKDCQMTVADVAVPLYEKYHILIQSCIRVPFIRLPQDDREPTDFHPLTESENADQEPASTAIDNEGTDDCLDDTFERNCNLADEEVKEAIYKTDKEISKLLKIKTTVDSTELPSDALRSDQTNEAEESDDMDSLFDSDNETNDREATALNSEFVIDAGDKLDNRVPLPVSGSNTKALMLLKSSVNEFNEKLRNLTQSVHETVYSLRTLFALAYDGLNCNDGQDIIASVVYETLFLHIGEHLQFLFRIANLEKEELMAEIMTKCREEDMSYLLVKEKWWLGTRGECYQHISDGLRNLVHTHSPLQKMSYAVQVNTGVVETATEYYRTQETEVVMGADDLLPVICFVIMKSALPEIVSQCAIMEEFIPAEYMMEKEGYALSTVLMAVQYLLTL